MDPMINAHFTPILFTMGPPIKQMIASIAYLIAVEMFDTRGVARPPPPRPVIASDMAGPQND
jgi:hypothetical protein